MKHPTPEQLTAFHDGIASAETIVAVEEHLNTCPECHEFLAALERQDRALTAALSHDPGDEHFESLAGRIEARLGEAPAEASAAAAPPGALRAVREWLAGYWGGLRGFRAPEWAGALAALIVGLGLVLLNLKHGTAPTLRNPALEQRAGQAAGEEKSADQGFRALSSPAAKEAAARDEAARAAAPAAPPQEAAREAAARSAPAPAAPAPSALAPSAPARQDASASRAKIVKSTPGGENQRAASQGFAQAPPAAATGPAAGQKQRFAPTLEENRPKNEGAPSPAADDKDGARARGQSEATATAKAAAPAPPVPARAPSLPSQPQAAGGTTGQEPRAMGYSEPQPKGDAGAAQGTLHFCGTVKDSRGQPVASASVTLVSQGRGVSCDAQGRFCIDAPPGDQTVSVMAVGYAPLRTDVRVAADAPPPTLTLLAISVIDGSAALRANARTLAGHAQTGAPGEVQTSFPDSLQSVASRAVRATLEAERSRSAQRYDAAAVEWDRVRERTTDPTLQMEARFRAAETRYRAWQLTPTASRVAAANEALTSFLVRAPLGARRDTTSAWLGRVKP
jgi:carboxypeptidase family protein/putative zinc finger protein